jgi:signal transduction histidine kinase/HAMP domain-containing protein
MTFEIWSSSPPQLPILPAQFLWTAVLTLLLAWAFARSLPRREEIRRSRVFFSIVCLMLAVPAGGLAWLRFPSTGAPTVAGVPAAVSSPTAGLLCVALLLLAGAFVGRLSALLAGLAVGAVRAVFATHQISSMLEYALAGWIIAEFLRQDYAGRAFSILREPWGASLASGAFMILLRFGSEMGSARGSWITLFDFALGRLPGQIPAVLMECVAGAVLVEVIRLAAGSAWPSPERLRTTRYHRSLAWKIGLWLSIPISFMALALTAIVVIDSRNQARQTLRQQILGVARTAQTDLPVAMMTGHTLLESIAGDLPSGTLDRKAVESYLGDRLSQPPFFEQIAFITPDGTVFADYPAGAGSFCQSVEEAQGCSLALRGVSWSGWLPPDTNDRSWIAFTQPVSDIQGGIRGALVGRTSMETNPLLASVPAAFRSLEGGQAVLLDERNRVVYPAHAEPWSQDRLLETDGAGGQWFLGTMSGGGTRLSYLLPLKYPDWKIGIRVPEAVAFRTALSTGLHVGLFALLMALLIEAVALLIAQQIISPLKRITESAGLIAAGDLERTVVAAGQDEIGRLGRSLESMRRNLRRQIKDQEVLLQAVQGMGSTLELGKSMGMLLGGVRTAAGADGVRIALEADLRDRYPDEPLYLEEEGKALAEVDDKILALVRQAPGGRRQTPWTASRGSGADEGLFDALPESIGALVVARIASVTDFYGALCVAFRRPQAFEVSLLDLMTGFANQASLAITNARFLERTEDERKRLAAILEAIPEGVLVVDSDDCLQYANPAAEIMLGTAQLGVGRPLAECLPHAVLADFLRESALQPRGLEFIGADGCRIQGVARSVRSAEGEGVWKVCVLEDVTVSRQLDDLKSEFVHTVSHDLRRPLTMMEGLVHMIEMLGPLNAAQQDYARRIRLSAQEMNRLVKDLLDLGRVESGVEIRRAPVKLPAVVARIVEEWKSDASAANIRISVDVPESIPDFPADASLLERAIGNLIENAIRFNRPGGSVEVGAKCTSDSVVISVQDTGIGIAPADQPRIFEKFFRVNPRDDPEHPAWGLGLAIVKSVAEWHGGRAWFESKLGKGSTFFLALPRKE